VLETHGLRKSSERQVPGLSHSHDLVPFASKLALLVAFYVPDG